ncbi:MAG TPA: RdgB/HAM1 family non-canonical purine NTP pyrophosphatase [Terriglobia bacterium]|nr:RdgB/HAM1 family non-canonical purine NTP pyrophosphatase [Terriglobia bacterium]
MILYIASTNPGKIKEFREAAQESGVTVEPLPGMRSLPACVEDGRTFEANARKKALHYSRCVNGLLLADDSGISVDALGGAPGVYSARFAGPNATDQQNNQLLLKRLREVQARASEQTLHPSPASRSAQYICVIALAERGRILTTTEGQGKGQILESPRGSGGFGYDPLFYFPPLGKTYAELSPEAKFGVSHRGEAFRKLLGFLATHSKTK